MAKDKKNDKQRAKRVKTVSPEQSANIRGGDTTRPVQTDIVIVKKVDKATPVLLQ